MDESKKPMNKDAKIELSFLFGGDFFKDNSSQDDERYMNLQGFLVYLDNFPLDGSQDIAFRQDRLRLLLENGYYREARNYCCFVRDFGNDARAWINYGLFFKNQCFVENPLVERNSAKEAVVFGYTQAINLRPSQSFLLLGDFYAELGFKDIATTFYVDAAKEQNRDYFLFKNIAEKKLYDILFVDSMKLYFKNDC